jgi:hypothetical protein
MRRRNPSNDSAVSDSARSGTMAPKFAGMSDHGRAVILDVVINADHPHESIQRNGLMPDTPRAADRRTEGPYGNGGQRV